MAKREGRTPSYKAYNVISRGSNRPLGSLNTSLHVNPKDSANIGRSSPKIEDVPIKQKSFGLVANKQDLFKNIRDEIYRIDPSEQLQDELDKEDKKYAREHNAVYKSLVESIQNAIYYRNASPMHQKKLNIEDLGLSEGLNANYKKPRAAVTKQRLQFLAAPIKTRSSRPKYGSQTQNNNLNASLQNSYREDSVLLDQQPTQVLQQNAVRSVRRRGSLLFPTASITDTKNSKLPETPISKRVEFTLRLPSIACPISLQKSQVKSIQPGTKFDLLYSYYKSPAARREKLDGDFSERIQNMAKN